MSSDNKKKNEEKDLFDKNLLADTSVSDIISEAFDDLQISEVGKICMDARVKKSLTQDQASAILKVKAKIIKDFENGDSIDLPGITYKVGFVRSYARLLGLEENFLVNEFKSSLQLVNYKQEYKFLKPELDSKNFLPIGAVLSFVIAIIVYSGWYYNEISKNPKVLLNQTADIKNEEQDYTDNYIIVEEKKDLSNITLSENSTKNLKDLPIIQSQKFSDIDKIDQTKIIETNLDNDKKIINDKKLEIKTINKKTNEMSALANVRDRSTEMVIKATGNSWVEIEDINGNTLMTRLMRSGETYVVPNKSGLTFNTGNAGALSLSHGNILIPALGEVGEIINARPLKVEAFQNKQIIN
jgi:cytoskeleton protein RodZ